MCSSCPAPGPGVRTRLIEGSAGRRGYLLKERLLDADQLVGALYRIVAGDTVIDPQVVAAAVAAPAVARRLGQLTPREIEVLSLLAEGLSDRGICERLSVSPKTVATHVQHIFTKLALPDDASANRRVHAVLTYLATCRRHPACWADRCDANEP